MPGSLIAERQAAEMWMRLGGNILAIGFILPVCLFVLGRLLGSFTLLATRRSWSGVGFFSGVLGKLGRLLYRSVIILSILYFYTSIPIILTGVLSLVGGAVYLNYLTPNYADSIVIIRIVMVIVVLFVIATFLPVIATTLFSSVPKSYQKSRFLAREEAPRLWEIIEEVAGRVGTRPVDTIVVNGDVGIAVSERGGLRQRLSGKTQRVLLLGLGALPGMTLNQFKAILAHEYGHFSNRDTAGGSWALKIHISFEETKLALGEELGSQGFFLLTLLVMFTLAFIAFYQRFVFFPITFGAKRLQEIQADRYAAQAYGGSNFASGLLHIHRQMLVFQTQFDLEELAARKERRRLHNLYTLPPLDAETEQKIAPLVEQLLNRPTSLWDTHPAARERIELIANLNADGTDQENLETVWGLLQNAGALQMEMTGEIQSVLYSRFGHSWAK